MPNADGGETREEYEERIRIVRATQIFGDTPTDPTIGDVVVPTHDEEGASVNLAAANADAEDKDDDTNLLSDAEVKRQGDAPQFDDVPVTDSDDNNTDEDLFTGDGDSDEDADVDPDGDGPELSREDKINAISNASSVEEVDALVGDDKRATVVKAADAKRAELAV